MDLISYRGPGAAGGVSSALNRFWKAQNNTADWWFVDNKLLKVMSAESEMAKLMTLLPDAVVDGHYRYCNEFLWPLLHDLPEHARYCSEDRESYKKFNSIMADYIDFENTSKRAYFVQDYQLSLMPQLLLPNSKKIAIFWHIPWPKNVPVDFIEPFCEIVRSLLSSDALGFHLQEYADNFLSFIDTYMPEYRIQKEHMIVESLPALAAVGSARGRLSLAKPEDRSSYIMRPLPLREKARRPVRTRLLVKPLGIDLEYWSTAGNDELAPATQEALASILEQPFILSVDRTDYTKSVFERMLLIDRFFEKHPQWLGSVTFVQLCGRTRNGLQPFDEYWHGCRALASSTNCRWQNEEWKPIVWLDHSLPSNELASLYRRASAMLVNPVRDGLNLTAMEYAACQKEENPGVLLLSPGAGAWVQIGSESLPVNPLDLDLSADSINNALEMPLSERRGRNQRLKERLEANTLYQWWKLFSEFRPTQKPVNISERYRNRQLRKA